MRLCSVGIVDPHGHAHRNFTVKKLVFRVIFTPLRVCGDHRSPRTVLSEHSLRKKYFYAQ